MTSAAASTRRCRITATHSSTSTRWSPWRLTAVARKAPRKPLCTCERWVNTHGPRSCGDKPLERRSSVHAPPTLFYALLGAFFCPFPFCFWCFYIPFQQNLPPFPGTKYALCQRCISSCMSLLRDCLRLKSLWIENNMDRMKWRLKDEPLKHRPKFFKIVSFILSGAWWCCLVN